MTRFGWIVSVVAIGGAMGVDAAPAGGESLEIGLLKAAASSGLIGLMLLWFVFQNRRDLEHERDNAAKREARLADRLNQLEDEIRNSLAGKLSAAEDAMERFEDIARKCHDRANS